MGLLAVKITFIVGQIIYQCVLQIRFAEFLIGFDEAFAHNSFQIGIRKLLSFGTYNKNGCIPMFEAFGQFIAAQELVLDRFVGFSHSSFAAITAASAFQYFFCYRKAHK